MTQNTEQNTRTRDAQLSSYPETVCVGQYSGNSWQLELDADDLDPDCLIEGPVLYVRCDIDHRRQKEAEARGAEEQRRKDAEGSLRPMSEVEKNRTPILAKIHNDLFPRVYPERKDLKCWNGRWVVISHTGILADGFDIGWGVAAPVGCGGLTDDWFVGWKPVDCPANVAALEAEIAALKEAEQLARADAEASKAREAKLKKALQEIVSMAEADCSYDIGPYLRTARAALTREGGV